jgi:hypothetical protein
MVFIYYGIKNGQIFWMVSFTYAEILLQSVTWVGEGNCLMGRADVKSDTK